MRIFLYPLGVVVGIYATFFVPFDILVGVFDVGIREERGICLFGAPDCETYWRSVGSFSLISYISVLVIGVIALKLGVNKLDSSDDGHDKQA